MLDTLKEIICQFVEVDESEITETARFSEDLGFNSFDFLSMLGEIEDSMDVELDEETAANKKTVGELLAYLEEIQ